MNNGMKYGAGLTPEQRLARVEQILGFGGVSGATDHGALTGLADDDHSQYHNDSRGDARYLLLDASNGPVTDEVSIGSDAGGRAEVGTYVGSSTYAAFTHADLAGSNVQYAIAQGAAGDTHVNAKTGQSLFLKIAGVAVATITNAVMTMAQSIAMGGNKITGLAAGTTNGDAVRYEQLVGAYLALTGGTLTGGLTIDEASGDSELTLDANGTNEGRVNWTDDGAAGFSMSFDATSGVLNLERNGTVVFSANESTGVVDFNETPTKDGGALATIASPTFTGVPAAPTPAQGTNTTQIPTCAYVQTEAGLLVPKSLVDAKGDLLVGSAADTVARLAVGSNGAVPMSDTGATNGIAHRRIGRPTGVDAIQAAGQTSIHAMPASPHEFTSTFPMVDGTAYLIGVYLPYSVTLAGVGFVLSQAGVYTADNNSKVALYDSSFARVATSADDTALWKATANTYATKAFSGTYAASAGWYYIGLLWNTSTGSPTIPTFRATPTVTNGIVYRFGGAAGTGLAVQLAAQTDLANPIAPNGTMGQLPLVTLYS